MSEPSNRNIIKRVFHNNFKGRKVLVLDLETTGLPERQCRDFKNPYKEYYHPKKIKYYNSSRIVQFSWYLLDFDNIEEDLSIELIKNFIVKCDFNIPEDSVNIHGISNEIANKQGIDINIILSELEKDIDESNVFLAHNSLFDYNVLLSELYRNDKKTMIKKMDSIVTKGGLFCSGLMTKYILKLGRFKNKMPKLKELYEYCFDVEPQNQHDARYDVMALVEIAIGRQC